MVLKCILALLTRGQKSFVSKIQPFTFATFDLGHPVHCLINFRNSFKSIYLPWNVFTNCLLLHDFTLIVVHIIFGTFLIFKKCRVLFTNLQENLIYMRLGVPATSWILMGDCQKLSFSTIKSTFLIFDQTNPLDAQTLPYQPAQQN